MKIGPSTPQKSRPTDRGQLSANSLLRRAVWPISLVAAGVLSIVLLQMLMPNGFSSAVRQAATDRGFGALGDETRLRAALLNLPSRLVDNMFEPPNLPTLTIDIKFKHLTHLHARRQEAMNIGYLVQREDDFVPASIRYGGQTIDAKLRLKGDMLDHLRTDKWSLRIHTKNDHQLFGLRRFSIQHPVTRGFQYEVLFKETLRRVGVLTPKYQFVNVTVNGDDVGLMALEEHFSKELLERNERKDGVIVRFDESNMWTDRVARGKTAVLSRGPFDRYQAAPISAFQLNRIRESESLSRQYAFAAGRLRAFVEKEIDAGEVFDVAQLGRFLAVAEFWGAWHALDWNNQRFYLNPLTLKLEPIGYDAHLEEKIDSGTAIAPGGLAHRMLENAGVMAEFRQVLAQLKSEAEAGQLIANLGELQESALRDLRTEFPLLEAIDLEQLRARAGELPYESTPPEPVGRFGVHLIALTIQDGDRAVLELSNPLPHTVEIEGIEWLGPKGVTTAFEPLAPLNYPVSLGPPADQGRQQRLLIEYAPAPAGKDLSLTIRSRLRNGTESVVTNAQPGFFPLAESPLPQSDVAGLLSRHAFLALSGNRQEIVVAEGQWQVLHSIVVPRTHALRIPGGTTLQFGPDAGLVAYGHLTFDGTAAKPVILEGLSDAGTGTWPGIVVHDAGERSAWKHTTVRGTRGVRWAAWDWTGGTTFYRSDVSLSNCSFVGNQAEDALNIIHSDFEMIDVNFLRSASDAFDSDFSTGTVRGGSYRNIGIAGEGGGDGLDVSGSELTVHGTYFSNIRDKAISVGERSRVTATGIRAEHCGICAVSKDDSTLEIIDSTISRANIAGLMSYVKKPEYGPAALIGKRIDILDTDTPAQAQHGSRLELNGENIKTQALDIDALYQAPGRSEAAQ